MIHFFLRSLVLLPALFLAQAASLQAQNMAEVVYKVYPYCANGNDPRNTVEDVRVSVYVDRKLLRPTGGFFEEALHFLRVVAEPKEGTGSATGKFFIKKIEWMKCAAGVNGNGEIIESRVFDSNEAAMTVNIDNAGGAKACFKAVIYVDKCGGGTKVEEAKVKLITTATQKPYKEEKPTNKIAVMIGDEKLPVDIDGTGFVKLPPKKTTFRVQWEGEGMSDPGKVTLRNTKTNSTIEVPPLPNRIAYIHEYAFDLSQFAGTENLYDYEIRINMIYEPRGTVNEVRVVGLVPGVSVHKAGAPDEAWTEAKNDMVLQQGDEISCDPDGGILLQFADNSTVMVRQTTQLKIASFFTEGGVVKTEILLKMGEVAAKVHKSEATKSDFVIRPPGGPGSVRGTIYAMQYDPSSSTTVVRVEEGLVDFSPVMAPGTKISLQAGQQVSVSGSRVGAVMPFTGKIDFKLPVKATPTLQAGIPDKKIPEKDWPNDLSGTWLLTQEGYTGKLIIRQEGKNITATINWDNHQKATVESFSFFTNSMLFTLDYESGLRGYYDGKLDESGKKMEGECLSNKGTSSRWSAVRQ